MTTTTTTTKTETPYADQILNPPPQQFKGRFAFDDFLRNEYRFGLEPSRKICPLFVQGHCPLENSCPDRHTMSSGFNNLVCKHWLRSLCKKGDACEFLHEYNLRKMPECNFFVRNGYCSNGEECLYLHVDPDSRIPLCPHYENGFCFLGPNCSKKHVRRQLACKFYLAGFCPEGRGCQEGAHMRWQDPKTLSPQTLKKPKEEVERERERERKQWQEREAMGSGEGGTMNRFQQGGAGRPRGGGGFHKPKFLYERGRDKDHRG